MLDAELDTVRQNVRKRKKEDQETEIKRNGNRFVNGWVIKKEEKNQEKRGKREEREKHVVNNILLN